MTNICRYNPHNTPVFITAVCQNRGRFLKSDAEKDLLLSVMREVKQDKPYAMMGYVILDDHFHIMIKIPEKPVFTPDPRRSGWPASLFYSQNPDFRTKTPMERQTPKHLDAGLPDNNTATPTISQIIQSIKLRFTHRYKNQNRITANIKIWQRRFWDHIIRNQNDYNQHMDYIHRNPVKHQYTERPGDYPWSSFSAYVRNGRYQPDWGGVSESAGAYGYDGKNVFGEYFDECEPMSGNGALGHLEDMRDSIDYGIQPNVRGKNKNAPHPDLPGA